MGSAYKVGDLLKHKDNSYYILIQSYEKDTWQCVDPYDSSSKRIFNTRSLDIYYDKIEIVPGDTWKHVGGISGLLFSQH